MLMFSSHIEKLNKNLIKCTRARPSMVTSTSGLLANIALKDQSQAQKIFLSTLIQACLQSLLLQEKAISQSPTISHSLHGGQDAV